MSSKKTPHYALNQWLNEDAVLRADFNDDNSKLDLALRALATGKADAAALAGLQASVSQKAEASTLSALQAQVSQKAEASALSALQANVNQKANAGAVSDVSNRVTSLENQRVSDLSILRRENCWQALCQIGVTQNTQTVTVPIGQYGPAQYQELHVIYSMQCLYDSCNVNMCVNDITSNHYFTVINPSSKGSASTYYQLFFRAGGQISGKLILRPHGLSATAIEHSAICSNNGEPNMVHGGCCLDVLPFVNLSTVKFTTQYPILANSQFTVYGLKK